MMLTPEEQRARLAQLLQEKVRKPKQEPLSFAQERMWFLDQWSPGSAVFSMPVAVRLRGELRREALERSLQEMVRRHEVLRTTFTSVDGRPLQVIAPALAVSLPFEDLEAQAPGASDAERERVAQERMAALVRQPFDLTQGPLLRAMLFRLAPAEHLLLLNMHHIIADGWSLGVMVQELASFYRARCEGRPAELPPLGLQYAEYAAWQREWLKSETLVAQLDWWRARLDPHAVLELPADKPRPAVLGTAGAREIIYLPAALTDAAKSFAQREGKTLFVVLLAVFKALLQRYTGKSDLTVGTIVAGRNRAELEPMIGLFFNTLALRTDVSGRPTFRALVERVHETSLGAFEHQDVPFERLVDALKPTRLSSHLPIFQVMFLLQNAPLPPLAVPGLTMDARPVETGTTKHDLTFIAVDVPGGLRLTAEYSTDLFEAATLQRLLGHFQVLLAGALAEPDRPIDELPLLTAKERRQILHDWDGPRADYPRDACLHSLIEAQAERTPEAVALVAFDEGGESLTYRELDERANQLAHHLRALGVGPEDRVGVCLERSLEMVIALLGTLKAGAAYVPLDPSYPRERLVWMLEDARPPVILTAEKLLAGLPGGGEPGGRVLCLDTGWPEVARHPRTRPAPAATADHLAYVIFTSGSTGRPKGAMNVHRALCNRLLWMQDAYGLGPGDVVLQKTPFSFDVSVWEFFWPLMVGARLVIARPGGHQDPAYLVRLIAAAEVTTLHFVPSMLQVFLQEPGLERCAALRRVICSGEALPSELKAQCLAKLPWAGLHNLYGPTEAAVDVTYFDCQPGSGEDLRAEPPSVFPSVSPSVSIGRPVANTQIRILDARLEPVPVGVPGELYIGGVQVGRGYTGRPELTAERFVPDPFTGEPGGRLYRTGDLVRWRPDGDIEYLGRTDFQVKIRGLRIELGEIETALLQVPGVRQVVVVGREDVPGDRRLVAYVVSDGDGGAAESGGLRAALQERLPEYMVPSLLLFLRELPLTPSGKIDRKALPAPSRADIVQAAQAAGPRVYLAPRNDVERQIAGIYTELLRVSEIGAHDDFFALGGHSLLATQVVSRLRSTLAVEMPVRVLFEAPTVAALAERVTRWTEESRGPAEGDQPPLPRVVPRTGELPLSFAQQRLWFLDQLEPGNPFYNLPIAVRMVGKLDVAALERSLAEVVRRHEALRTTFVGHEGRPVQVLAPELDLRLDLVDLQDQPPELREARARERAQEEVQRPFDLARGPLLRACLLRLGAEDHVLLVTLHHIVADGWSLGVLVREFGALYSAFSSGQPSPLAPLVLQYVDYAAWQREWLAGAVLERQLAYWKGQLGGRLPVLELPTDYPGPGARPPVQTFRGAQHVFTLPRPLAQALDGFSRRQGATLFMTLLAAFQALLQRYSGQDDIVVGTPIAGRTRAELEGLIGLFVNTLALRTDLGGNPTFRTLLGRVREVTLGAYAHQELPFEKLVEELEPERDLSRSPLFQVLFALQNMPIPALAPAGLTITPVELDAGIAKFDLSLYLQETAAGLRGVLEYNTDLFEAATIARMAGHFESLLRGIAADPDQPLAELPLLTAAEREQLLVTWNQTRSEAPADACIHTLFEAQVRRTPDRVALVDGTRELGYAELNRRANQLAHTLRALGVRAEAPVGICMRRTAEMVIGLLGILKAGATYVPLDPAYPRERLAFVLEDARVQLLLTQSQLVERLPDHGARVLCLDADGERIAQASDEDPVGVAAPGQLAYLIYTSGSTGRPKGVAIEHRQAVAFLHWAGSVFSPAMLAGTLAGTSINFDLSVFELFLPLASGSAVILADTVLDLPRLPTAAAERVTLINTVPSAVAELLRAEAMPAGVRNVNLAGEPLSTALVKRLYECPGIERVHDLYGPSETTTYSTYTLRRADAPATIGRPIDGTRVYVLDRRLMPVPLGVPGELYIGGAGVARGYLGRPDLTAERFLPDPFGDVPGARLYRTGDLVRWRPGGELEYLGRRDFQVKVRGFRIELGEIESALGQHPSVRQAVVVAREDRPGDKRLVGYLVASPAGIGAAPSIAELREFLKQRLPEYMVPAAFVFLDQLPLTPSGKIDRRALPAPEAAAPTSEHVAPRTPVEESLAGIWAEVLGRSQPHGSAGAEGAGGIGVEDNFFELGGHSLLATQIISRVRTAFQVELPVRALFEVPTVAGMARAIEALRKTAAAPQAPSLRAVRSGEDLPLSFAQQRLWFLDQLQPGDPSYNLLSAVRVTGPLDAALLQRCLEEIVGRHEVLRTTFAMRDGQPIQVIAPAQTVPITVLDLRDASGPEQESRVRALAEEEARHPFDLARGPLLRVTMLYLAPEVHVLLLGMHHIAADGWSNGVLLRELAALYQAFRRGQPSPLPPLPLQYADHALWQRSWLSGEVLAAQVAYWRQQLTGAPPVLELPTDRPRPVARSFRGATETLQLPRDLSEALRALGRREGATPFMVLLAAFQALLYRYSGQDDISVGVPVAGRTHVETERLIGFFANTLVLRSRLAGDQTVQALLAQVREATLGAYAHQDVPFEKLVEELQPARNLSYSPLFQVMVGMLPPAEPLASPGFVLEPIDVDRATAKFDLTLAWVDRPEGFTGSLTYNTDIFDAATIVRLLGYFQVLLTAAVESPGRRLDELPLLSNEDLRRSRDHWFAPLRAYEETDRCVQELFEAHAARTPEAIAVSSEHGQLTYRELNRRANQLGRHLRSLGVGPEVPVGIFLEGSSEMVLCMLGILKAGGAYVPIDPLFPAERMRYMLEDSGAPVLLSKSSMRDRIPAIGIPVLYVDAAAERLAAYDGGDFPSGATIASKVYIIYTSGSTGRPKGVVIEHRQLLNYLHAVVERVGLEDCREFAMLQPLAVDSCKTVVYPALCRGGTLHVLPRDRASDPHVVAAYFRRHTIDVLKIAPSHLAALVNAAPSRDLLPRRVLVIGGEASHWEWVRTLAAMAPEIRLFNHYGPTEATVGMLTYPIVPDAVPPGGSVVPLGRPLPNTEAFILNAAMEPVPIGVPGEIYIGGQCLARGYLNEPRLTADRFVPSPFSDVPGSRLYRTGDMAKWLPGGFVEYLGRTDHQIKIRGFRIEPGEIAAVLKQHAGVQEALVMARDDGTGDKRLVAYVVPRPGAGPRPVEAQADTATTAPAGGEAIEVSPVVLRNFLKDRVPDYMVPAAVMLLEALPLTPHGKVDLGALPAPGVEIDERNGLVAPRTPREAELAAIWQTILRREPIGVTDDFFEVGGHSLLATQVVARIRTAFQIELPVRALFEAPTIAGLAERIDEALRAGERAATPPLVPMPRTEALPLSFAQQRLWFLDQLEPGSPFYNIPAALRLRGTLDVQALGQSFAALVARHESLRTIFASGLTTRDGQPVQRVVPALSPRIEPLDLTGIPEAEREARALAIAQEEALRPFDLAHGPLLRVSLLRLGADDHVLLVVLHHIVSDGWSTGILIRDLGALYQAFSQKQPAPLAPLPIQYADFALWQRTWLAGPVLERQLAYWREQLGGRLPVLELPTDRPRPPVQTHHGAQHRFTLPAGLSQSLEALGHEHGVTLFMTLLAAFQTLLHRYTGQEDLIVGTPSAGRTRAETEDLIGFFVNTLALRTRLRRGMTFRDLLAEVREVTLAAHAHQEVPFERVVEALEPERDLSRPPIFQVMFGLQNLPAQALALPGLVLTPVEFEGRVAKFDLSLFLQEGPEGLRATLEYNTDLFDAATAARMAGHFRVLLEGLAARPESTLAELPLLDTAERHRLLAEWAQGAALAPADACMHELFEAQAARTPEAAALIDGTRTLSYVELDQHASRLARELRALGVGPETTVGICLERSWRMVVGLLGILKAGGTYVPLDPAYPEERLALIMADAQIQALVTEQRSRDRLPATAARILYLEEDLAALQHARTDEPVRRVSPQGLAYLIYTSGSTGRPKGVAIEHRQAVAFLSWAQGVFEPAVLAGTLAATSIAFDLSIFELFLPLARGGTVILARTVLDLPELPAAERVTLVNTVPSAMSELVRAGQVPAGVRVVNLAGEPLSVALVEALYRRSGIDRVHDLYGPSETTTYSTQVLRRPGGTATIGRPIAGTQVYVLDERLEPVPVGVPGELYIGGAGVTRGYLGRPELTAERFVPDPFGPVLGARLYRTGDRVRWRPAGQADEAGQLEYLGRVDFQVKVRGFRIELGEIEAVLAAHPGVRQAVVVTREERPERPGDRRLVAYVVPAHTEITTSELREALRQRLPEYMVPAAFVMLPELPRTPSGKLDRRALPAPELASHDAVPVAPRTPTEELLADIWAEVLGRPRGGRLGVEDNFFEVGGHSLLATQVVARIRSAFKVELPVRALFEAPTIAALARRIEEVRVPSGNTRHVAPAPVPRRRSGAVPLSFAQQRLWFLDQLQPGNPFYNLPAAVRVTGPLDVELAQRCLDEIVRRHEVLRTFFATRDGQPMQIIAPYLAVPLAVVDVQDVPPDAREAHVRGLVEAEAQRPFDLGHGPLLRATLLRLAPDEHVLLLVMHHIASDGWSSGVWLREFGALYKNLRRGQPSPLPPLPLQYADYALWQRSWLQGEVLDGQLAYWRQQLGGTLPVLDLPTDRPRPPVQTFHGTVHTFTLPPELTQGLRTLSRQHGATLFMTLLGAFQTLLYRYTGQPDVIVGSPIAGRTHAEFEGLIGFFVNTLALRTDLGGRPSFRDVLARVREVTLGAYAHQELPFEKLVETLKPDRDLGRTPIFQVAFALQNLPPSRLDLDGLTLQPLEGHGGIAKFDLSLYLWEVPGSAELRGTLEYNTDLFEAVTMARLVGHFQTLLAAALAEPDRAITELPLLTVAERHAVVEVWPRNDVDDGETARGACIHERFAAQAAKTPEALAVAAGTRSLRYGELEARSNQLARVLRARGVGPETPVAVFMERSPEMVLALLGVLKAGGAYVPLDPAYPAERIAFLLEDTGAPVLLTQTHLVPRLPSHVQGQPGAGRPREILCLDGAEATLASAPPKPFDPGVTPDHLAYIIYTSGSTGRPKGVQVTHRALEHLVAWHDRAFGVTPADRATQVAGPAFDASVWEIWPYLLAGASLHMPGDENRASPEALRDWLVAERITLCFLPTPLCERVLPLAWPKETALRYLLTGGDQLRHPPPPGLPFALINNYGPTESTVVATSGMIPPSRDASRTPDLGRPIDHVRVYLLDRELQPVPVGVPGEIHLGGAGLARGYGQQPGLTAERFVPDPFSGVAGARLYRTGDLGRWRPDGRLEFLGRTDFQVKVRGFRIELGEIEAVLQQHPDVLEAVVVAREERAGDRRLIAYLEAGARPPEAGVLRDFLRARLPEYMVPAAFIVLDQLPLTPHDKVDRRALAARDVAGPALDDAPAPPRDELEATLVHLWQEVLGLETVGIRHNFFDLGGHSLLAVQLASRVQEALGQRLPLVTLFQHPTVEQLAAALRRPGSDTIPAAPLCLQDGDARVPPLFLVHGAGGSALGYAALVKHLGPAQPCHGLQAPEFDGAEPWDASVETLARHYVEQLRTVQPAGPYQLGGWSFGGVVAFEMAQQLAAAGEAVSLLALVDSHAPTGAAAPPDELGLLAAFGLMLGLPWREIPLDLDHLRGLQGRARLAYVLEQAARASIQVPGIDLDQAERLFRRFQRHGEALARYVPRVYEGSVVLLKAAERLTAATPAPAPAPDLGWRPWVRGELVLHTVPGHHYTLLREPHVAALAETLRPHLAPLTPKDSSPAHRDDDDAGGGRDGRG